MRNMKDSGVEWIGEIPVEWEVRKVKAVLNLQTGFTPDTKNDDYYADEGADWVTIGDLDGTKYIPTATKKKISKEYIELFSPEIVPAGSLLYSFKLSVGQTAFTDRPVYTNEAIASFQETDGYSMEFLRFASFLIEYNANTNIYGAHLLNQELIKNALLVVPPIEEQRRIASFLDMKFARVDRLIENVQRQIEKLKAYKQSVITEVVTKGLNPSVPMKNSGVEWLGEVPNHWDVYRIANLYAERSENGLPELPILTVSINTGVSDHEVEDKDKDRVFIRMEDRSKYKRVCPGDLTYNMMRAWQGAFGAVRVDGLVSPAYVVAKPKNDIPLDSRYIEALLRTPVAIEEMHRYSRGIVDFRLRLYWPEFKNICICLPPIEEQQKIADYIDEIAAKVDALVAIKQTKIEKLEQYKRSLIYEYVTGKKEVS